MSSANLEGRSQSSSEGKWPAIILAFLGAALSISAFFILTTNIGMSKVTAFYWVGIASASPCRCCPWRSPCSSSGCGRSASATSSPPASIRCRSPARSSRPTASVFFTSTAYPAHVPECRQAGEDARWRRNLTGEPDRGRPPGAAGGAGRRRHRRPYRDHHPHAQRQRRVARCQRLAAAAAARATSCGASRTSRRAGRSKSSSAASRSASPTWWSMRRSDFIPSTRQGRFLFVNATLAALARAVAQRRRRRPRLSAPAAGARRCRRTRRPTTPSARSTKSGEVTLKGPTGKVMQAYIRQEVVPSESGTGIRTRSVVHDLGRERALEAALRSVRAALPALLRGGADRHRPHRPQRPRWRNATPPSAPWSAARSTVSSAISSSDSSPSRTGRRSPSGSTPSLPAARRARRSTCGLKRLQGERSATLYVSRRDEATGAGLRLDRPLHRHHRAQEPRGAVRAVAEDAGGRPARRRRRPRLQQPADGDDRLLRPAAGAPPRRRPVLRRHHADQAERQPRRQPGAPAAGLLAPADPAAARRSTSPTCWPSCRICCAA